MQFQLDSKTILNSASQLKANKLNKTGELLSKNRPDGSGGHRSGGAKVDWGTDVGAVGG